MKVFHEVQKFDQWWFRILMLAVFAITIGSIYMSVNEIENDNNQIIVILSATLITFISIVIVMVYMKLETKINEQGIYYKFWPFNLNYRIISWSEIKECYVKEYNPIADYGGWGYRGFTPFRSHGKAFNVKGNIGIQIVLQSRKKILIGTQKKEEAENIINTYNYKLQKRH